MLLVLRVLVLLLVQAYVSLVSLFRRNRGFRLKREVEVEVLAYPLTRSDWEVLRIVVSLTPIIPSS